MNKRLAVLMDPIESIKPAKDSSLSILLSAQQRCWALFFIAPDGLSVRDGLVYGHGREITVYDDTQRWFTYDSNVITLPLHRFDLLFMRQDPPVDRRYLHNTQLLAMAEQKGLVVANKPAALQGLNEKIHASHFPTLTPPHLISNKRQDIEDFITAQQEVILKPLDGMGGQGIFRLKVGDPNYHVILETVLAEQQMIVAQRYLPAIAEGDKRLILIDGEPFPLALARIPAAGESRANLAVGGRGICQELNARDRAICAAVGPVLRHHGIWLAGLDVIGDWLTEVNITSPTGLRELSQGHGEAVADRLMAVLERQCEQP